MRSLSLIAALAVPAQLLLGQQATRTSGSGLSLEDAINVARQNNPAFLQTKNLVRDQDASVRATYGALMPSVSAQVGTNYTAGGPEYYQGVQLGNTNSSYQSNYRLGLNYSVSSSAAFAPRAARANRAASDANVTSSSEMLRSNVTTQYIQALEQQATAAVNDTLVQTAQGQLDLANAKMKVGAGTILDVTTAQVALGQAQVAALQAHNQARIEKLKLFQLMGVPPDESTPLTTQFTVTPPPMSLDSLLQLARRVNPDLAAKKSTEFADRMQVRVAQSSYLPSLNLSTGIGGNAFGFADINQAIANQNAQYLSEDPTVTSHTLDSLAQITRANNRPFAFTSAPFSFSASLSLPIFNNFSRELNIEQAQVAHDNANYDIKARDLQLTTDVTTDYLTLVTDEKTVEMQEQNAQSATEALNFAEESYKVGAKTFLDVTTARGQYEQALNARVTAIYEYHKAFAALEGAVGRPLR
jgi:outer membrane protein